MKRTSNRRQFLKCNSAFGVGFWIGANHALAESRSANDKLNIAMIGCGGKGSTNLLLFSRPDTNIVALCDVDDQRGAQGFALHPAAKRYHDFRELLDKQKDIDAVVISTPDHTHAAAAIGAMKLGKHVYCEKPMAHSVHAARMMTRAAAETNVATQMGNQGHAGKTLRRAVQLVQEGVIGKVREFHAWTNRPSWPQGMDRPTAAMPVPPGLLWDLWLGPAPERPYHEAYVPFKWCGWWDFGTGALGDMACHVIDLGFWALQLGYPISVEAEVSMIHDESAPSWSIIRYEFPARGDLPPVKFTWYDGGKQPDPALVDGQIMPSHGSLLIGDQGKMFVPETYRARFLLLPLEKFADLQDPTTKPTDKISKLEEISMATNHCHEWVAACKGGPPAKSNFVDYAGLLTEVVLLGNVAMRVGKRLEWDGPNMKAIDCPEADRFVRRVYRNDWMLQ